MAKEKNNTVTPVTPVKESMKYRLEFADGTVIEGNTSLREFQPNTAKGFHNSGFQVKVADGNYSGNIMIIDYTRQKALARK